MLIIHLKHIQCKRAISAVKYYWDCA